MSLSLAPHSLRYSIVLPCYNEAGTIPSLFERFAVALQGRSDFEVIFVNNGSRDESAVVFAEEESKPDRTFARVLSVEVNQGYGFGILNGLQAARGEFVGWTHADSQYDPAIALAGFEALRRAPDPMHTILRGRRVQRNWFDVLFTAGMSVVASSALGTRLSDVNAQPKLFHRSFLGLMREPPSDFSLDLYTLFLARRHGYQFLELPVVFNRRLHGKAKGGGSLALKWNLSKRTLMFILHLRRDVRSGRV